MNMLLRNGGTYSGLKSGVKEVVHDRFVVQLVGRRPVGGDMGVSTLSLREGCEPKA